MIPGMTLPEEVEVLGEPICEVVLGTEITKERCEDFRASRQWVMCRAQQLLQHPPEGRPIGLSQAMKMAWGEMKGKCIGMGAVAEEEPDIVSSYLVVSPGSETPVGHITLDQKGHVGLCLGGTCVMADRGERGLLTITLGLLQSFGLDTRRE